MTLWWLIAYWLEVSESELQLRTGATLGIMMGTKFILFFWALGAGVTGLLVMMMTRGPKNACPVPHGDGSYKEYAVKDSLSNVSILTGTDIDQNTRTHMINYQLMNPVNQ